MAELMRATVTVDQQPGRHDVKVKLRIDEPHGNAVLDLAGDMASMGRARSAIVRGFVEIWRETQDTEQN